MFDIFKCAVSKVNVGLTAFKNKFGVSIRAFQSNISNTITSYLQVHDESVDYCRKRELYTVQPAGSGDRRKYTILHNHIAVRSGNTGTED